MSAHKISTFKRLLLPLLHLLCLIREGALNEVQADCSGLDLFGSKTGYSDLLGKCLTSKNELFDGKTLEQRHTELTDSQQCKPVALFLIGRHAARQPSHEELTEINRNLDEFLDLVRLQSSRSSNQFLRWRSPFNAEQADLVTELGAQKHRELARRLKQIYPKFFDANSTRVELATTSKLRTLQSGVEFIKEVDNFKLAVDAIQHVGSVCELKKAPKEFFSGKASDLACFAGILSQYQRIELEFHKVCKKRIKQDLRAVRAEPEKDKTGTEILRKIARIKQSLLNEVAGRIKLKLSLNAEPSAQIVSSAYETCIYETSAIYGTSTQSVWCRLFEHKDLVSLEYLEDAKIFHKTAQNRDSYRIQSSPIMRDLLLRLERASSVSSTETQAYFGFTHDGIMKKLLATLGLFDGDDKGAGYKLEELQAFESARLVPERRLWRSSLMVPFSANVLITLYKCEGDGKLERGVPSFKLLSSISERPVSVKGCKGSICPLEEFLESHKSAKSYNDQEVCQEVRNSMGL